MREPLIALDQDLRIVKVSRSFYDFFKVKPEDTVGQLIYDLGNNQWNIPKLRELLETILPQKATFDNYEVEHEFATIGRRIMLLNARQIEQALGKERIILLAIEDITERKEIEAGLEKTRKELAVIKKTADEASEFAESLINTVREPLIALDQDLRVVSVSRSFYDFFKVKPEDTMGQLIYDLGNKQWDIPKLRELLETILPQKATFDNYEVEHEFATIGRRIMLLNARQIEQALGKERIILLAIEDITEHKRLEILLTDSEELYRGVFKTASDGIVLLEKREGKITHANPAAEKMLGYSIKECIGNKLQDIGFMLDLGDFQTTMQNLNKNGIINYEDVPVKTKSGQHINTDIYLVDKTKAVQCNIRDITDRIRAEEALRNSEKNFRRSLDDSPLGVRIVTPKGETIYANRTILDFYSYDSMDEINRIPIKERYTPQSYAEFQMRKKDRERGDFGPSEYEINIVRKNKKIRHLQVLRKEILWDGTKQFQVMYQDITERKWAEAQREAAVEALQVSEEKLNEAQALGQIGNWEFDINTQKITWSKQVYKLYERDPVLGPPTTEEEAAYYSPEQAQTLRGYIRIAIETGQFFECDLQATLPSGKHVYLTARLRPIKDAQGRVIKLFGIVQDITERKRAESQREAALEALRESEEKYRTLFTSSSDAIMLIESISGKFISGNQTAMEMFGLKNDDFSSFGLWDFSPERQPDERASAEKAKEMNEIAMRDGSNFFEWSHKRLNGEEFSTNVRLTRMVLDKKTILQATVRDITERKRAEESIRASLVEKEILLKEVHHRVKNNLMIIIGLIKMQETKANNEMFNPLLQELEGRIRSMALVHESLYKSKDLAHVNLQNYIEMMSTQIHAQFGADRDIRFSVQAAGVDVDLDSAVPCGLILNELLTNAFKHAFPAGRPGSGAGKCEIKVIVNQEGGMNVLTVADNGVGLPADLDWEKSDTLGLRLIKMLSKQINGSIELDRSAGTAFRLKFPVAEKIH